MHCGVVDMLQRVADADEIVDYGGQSGLSALLTRVACATLAPRALMTVHRYVLVFLQLYLHDDALQRTRAV